MTLWEFACARAGFMDANGGEKPSAPAMDGDRLAELGIEGF